jgi:hypothetical protein
MLSSITLPLAAFYTLVGIVIIRRLRKPTCRISLFRQLSPNRQGEHLSSAGKPCWGRDQTTE